MFSHEICLRQNNVSSLILFPKHDPALRERVTTNAIACQPNTMKCNAFTMKRRKKSTSYILVHELKRRTCSAECLALGLL